MANREKYEIRQKMGLIRYTEKKITIFRVKRKTWFYDYYAFNTSFHLYQL